LILSQPVTTLGRAEHLALPFLGMMNKEIELEHLKITRQTGGRFVLEDNRSRLGTRLNNQPVQGPMPLKDGDVIKFGTNFVRFNERHKRAGQPELAPPKAAFSGRIAPPPPPPICSPAGGPPPKRRD
jgi:pSer/pThr/pTyr-binding forkhead associated (FHA) protein